MSTPPPPHHQTTENITLLRTPAVMMEAYQDSLWIKNKMHTHVCHMIFCWDNICYQIVNTISIHYTLTTNNGHAISQNVHLNDDKLFLFLLNIICQPFNFQWFFFISPLYAVKLLHICFSKWVIRKFVCEVRLNNLTFVKVLNGNVTEKVTNEDHHHTTII